MSTKVERYDEAIALDQDGKSEEALAKFEALVKDEPDYALVHSALSVFYGKLDRLFLILVLFFLACLLHLHPPTSH